MASVIKTAIVALWLAAVGVLFWRNTEVGTHLGLKEAPRSPGEVLAANVDTATADIAAAEDEWYGMYIQGQKVGYSHTLIQPVEGGFVTEDEMFVDLKVMGQVRHIRSQSRGRLAADYSFENLKFTLESEGSNFQVEASREENKIAVRLMTAGGDQNLSIPVEGPLYTSVALYPYLRKVGIRTGETHRLTVFDPTIQDDAVLEVRIGKKEDVEIGKEKRSLYKVDQTMVGVTTTTWMDEDARLWKETSPEGFTVIRETKETASEGMGASTLDLGVLFSVPLQGKKFEHPESLKRVVYAVEGVPENFGDLSGFRQKFAYGRLTIEREKKPVSGNYELPYRGQEEKVYLEDEPLIPASDSRLKATARKIIGKERDPASVVKLLTRWVYSYLENTAVVGIPNALEALESRRGDCNEHATLMVALGRAAGIPSRVATGLVYLEGSFYYHAWTEFYTGEWVSADATTNQLPVDVTHIRLVSGPMASQSQLLNVMGKLKLTLEEAQ